MLPDCLVRFVDDDQRHAACVADLVADIVFEDLRRHEKGAVSLRGRQVSESEIALHLESAQHPPSPSEQLRTCHRALRSSGARSPVMRVVISGGIPTTP